MSVFPVYCGMNVMNFLNADLVFILCKKSFLFYVRMYAWSRVGGCEL